MTITRKAVGAAVAVTALGVAAPPASATHEIAHCRYAGIAPTGTPGTWDGVVEGHVAGGPAEWVSVRCVFKVDGAVRAASSTGSGTAVAATAGRVTYIRTVAEVAELCVQVGSGHGSSERCTTVWSVPVPPDFPQYAVAHVALVP